jgi:hypothetical protein
MMAMFSEQPQYAFLRGFFVARVLKQIVSAFLGRIDMENMRSRVLAVLYETRFGAAIQGTARIDEAAIFALCETLLGADNVSEICKAIGAHDLSALVSADSLAIVLDALATVRHQTTAHGFIREMKVASPLFALVFVPKQQRQPQQHAFSRHEVIAKINSRYPLVDNTAETHSDKAVDFYSPCGPSVFECVCGFSFLPKDAATTPMTIGYIAKHIKEARAEHFESPDVYGACTSSGNPCAATSTRPESQHTNVHSTVTKAFESGKFSITDSDDAIVEIVGKMIVENGRGNINSPFLARSIRDVLPSFRALEPPRQRIEQTSIATKVLMELQLRNMPREAWPRGDDWIAFVDSCRGHDNEVVVTSW